MTPLANTLYSVCLFLSLVSLLEWSKRRHRAALRFRKGLSTALGEIENRIPPDRM